MMIRADQDSDLIQVMYAFAFYETGIANYRKNYEFPWRFYDENF